MDSGTIGWLQRQVRAATEAVRTAARGKGRVRLVRPVNVVVARNVGGHGSTHVASAHQTIGARNGALGARSEQAETHSDSDDERSDLNDGAATRDT